MRVATAFWLSLAATLCLSSPASAQETFQVVHAFTSASPFGTPDADGWSPIAPTEAADHFLYGTTQQGGANGQGVIYRLDQSNGSYMVLASFSLRPRPSTFPLVEGVPGSLYGIGVGAPEPGSVNESVLYRFDVATATITVVYVFARDSSPGPDPTALVRTTGGHIYGTASSFFDDGPGTIFHVDAASSSVGARAAVPRASTGRGKSVSALTPAPDGWLYGSSTENEEFGEAVFLDTGATVFRFNPATNAVEVLHSLSMAQLSAGALRPGLPFASTADDLLYASWGQKLVRFDPATRVPVVVNMPSDIGAVFSPAVGLDGALYMNGSDAARTASLLVRFDPATARWSVLHSFTSHEGRFTFGPVVTGSGVLYGITAQGVAGGGTIFRLALSSTLPPLDTDGDGLPNNWEVAYGLNPSSASGVYGPTGDPDGDGRTNLQELQSGTHPRGFVTRHFAEGATGSFFATRFAALNTDTHAGRVLFRFLKDDGTIIGHAVDVGSNRRVTVDVASLPGLANANFSTIVESDAMVAVDRTMTWDARGYGSDTETAVAAPATTWYFAEGSTSGDFNLFYLLENPGDGAVSATVRYLLPFGQAPIEKTYVLAPHSRRTIYVNTEGGELASTDVGAIVTATGAIVAERAMYMNKPGRPFAAGHGSAGVTAPSLEWFFAEGATGTFFDEFLLVANPSASAAEIAVDYLLPGGGTLTKSYAVPAQGRLTIWVDDEQLPANSGIRPLASTALSAIVRSTNGVPVVAERTMWWPGPEATANFWYEAHNSPGATAAARRWALAEGEQGGPANAETYILIANPSASAGLAAVTVTVEGGSAFTRSYPLPPRSRTNVPLLLDFPAIAGKRFGTIVESVGSAPVSIVVERAMYSTVDGVFWAAGTDALGAPVP